MKPHRHIVGLEKMQDTVDHKGNIGFEAKLQTYVTLCFMRSVFSMYLCGKKNGLQPEWH